MLLSRNRRRSAAFDTLQLHRVDLRVLSFNVRALRCYEKCGFVREGVERESAFVDGARVDDVMMSLEFAAPKRQLVANARRLPPRVSYKRATAFFRLAGVWPSWR